MASDMFCCQVCLNEPPANIYQCHAGHLFCNECWDSHARQGSMCPTCRKILPLRADPVRNRALEQMLDLQPPRPCQHCRVPLRRQERQTHVCNVEDIIDTPKKLEQVIPGQGTFTYSGSVSALVLKRHKDVLGTVTHYEDSPPAKRRKIHSSGEMHVFEGVKGKEVLRRVEFPCGQKTFYEGVKGEEAMRSVELPNGKKKFYEGAKGQEAKRRQEDPNGKKKFYEGAKRQEALRRLELPNGEKKFYEGVKGHEVLRRTEFPDGTVYHA